MDVLNYIKRHGFRRYEGTLTLFSLTSYNDHKMLPLFQWENPFVLELVKLGNPNVSLKNMKILLDGKEFVLSEAQMIGNDDSIEELNFSLFDPQKEEQVELIWRGEEIIVFSTVFPQKRDIELYYVVKLPFRMAVDLIRAGYPTVRDKFVLHSVENLSFDELLEKKDSISNKILHPINIKTQNPYELYAGLREVADLKISTLRIATYSLDIIIRLENIYQRLMGIRLGASKDALMLLKRVSELFWLERPLLRNDPILPPKNTWTELFVSIWDATKDIFDKREKLNVAMSVVREQLDINSIIIRIRGLLES